jgi:RNA polymerase sigma-70 factor (ECF subfamily)
MRGCRAHSQQATLRAIEDDELRAIVDGYVDAWERADVDAVVGMLADQASLTMPPQSEWYRGRDAIAAFLATRPLTEGNRWRVVPTHANGQLAFGHYIERAEGFVAESVAVVTLRDTQIEDLTIFRTPALVERFALAARLEGY